MSLPPPPTDPAALVAQQRRVGRNRAIRAVFLSAVVVGSVVAIWALSAGEVPTRSEWAFRMTQVRDLQDAGLDGRGEVICLVDTGIDPNHPDLSGVPIRGWRDFVRGRADPYDDDGHGTAMAGIIAARGALMGVAPGVALIVAKALDAHGMGTSAGLASAINFCVDPNGDGNRTDGADIVSLSLAAASNVTVGSDVTSAVTAALGRGIVIVASAGNDRLQDDGDVQNPASIDGVIAVGSIDQFGALAAFSSQGADAGRTDPNRKPELVAPGVDLLTTARGGGYQIVSGTSASAAFVSGIVALLLQDHPGVGAADTYAVILSLKTALTDAAHKAPGQATPHDPNYGYGVVAAADADALLP